MVTVNKGKVMVIGDSVDIALDIITFLGAVNEMKKHEYNKYRTVEEIMLTACKEDEAYVETIKEFAVNMTEVFS